VGRLIAAGFLRGDQGARIAHSTKIDTNTTPVAARGLWRAARRSEMAAVDMRTQFKRRVGRELIAENVEKRSPAQLAHHCQSCFYLGW